MGRLDLSPRPRVRCRNNEAATGVQMHSTTPVRAVLPGSRRDDSLVETCEVIIGDPLMSGLILGGIVWRPCRWDGRSVVVSGGLDSPSTLLSKGLPRALASSRGSVPLSATWLPRGRGTEGGSERFTEGIA